MSEPIYLPSWPRSLLPACKMPEASYPVLTTEAQVAFNTNEYCLPRPIADFSFQGPAPAAHRLAPHYALAGQGGHVRGHVQPSPNGGPHESCTHHCGQVLGSHGGTPGALNRFAVANPCGGDMMPGMVAGHHPMGIFPEMNNINSQMSSQGGNLMSNYHGGASMAGTQCMPSPMAPHDCRSGGHSLNYGQLSPAVEASRTPYGHPRAHTYVGPQCSSYSTPLDNSAGYDHQIFRSAAVMSQSKVFQEYHSHYSEYLPSLEEQHPQGCEVRLPEQGGLVPKIEPDMQPERKEIQSVKGPRKRG